MIDHWLEHVLAEIHATLDGRDFSRWNRIAGGWGAWSYYAATGEWI